MCVQAIVGKDSYVEFLNITEKGGIINFRPKLTPLSEFEIISDNILQNSSICQTKAILEKNDSKKY
jgi:hypothetical protein